MFHFRASTSSASSPCFPTSRKSSHSKLYSTSSVSSDLSTASSAASSASSNSILSLLHAHAHASVSTSSSLASALSPASSFASLPSKPCLTAEPLSPSVAPTADTSEPEKAAASPARPSTSPSSTSHRASRLPIGVSPRRTSLLTSPRTSRATTTTTISARRPSTTTASCRRSTISPANTEPRSSPTATMAKKAKVGSAAKSSPFAKLAAAEKAATESASSAATTEAESCLATVAEDDVAMSATATTTAAPTKAAAATSSSSSPPSSSESKQNVVVCVRMRPSRASTCSSDPSVWNCDSTKNQIVPTEHHPAIAKRTTSSERAGAGASIAAAAASAHDLDPDDPSCSSSSSTYHFQFDKLITGTQTTDDMYHSHIAPVVRAAMEGYNGTVFAYGQTGSGKTHTMSGSDAEPGVIPRAVQQVFQMIEAESDREFLLRVSYLEIYNETLKDLLAPLPPLSASLQTTDRPASPTKGAASVHAAGASQSSSSTLRIIEDPKSSRVIITGLREEIVTDADTVLSLIQRGQDERHVGATDWNERSSRSHCVFQLTIESRSSATREIRISQLNLIDLAGSERAASQAERRKEGAFINKSLLTLGTVIGKLTEPSEGAGDAHIPYRDSKLTRILQTSLSGNARIAVICTLSPDAEHANETLSTLKFGKRCKLVVTTAKRGTAMDDKALLQKYRKELDALRAKLEANCSPHPHDGVATTIISPELSRESQQQLDELDQQRQAAQREVEDMQRRRTDLKGQIEHLTRLILTSRSVASDASSSQVAGPSTPVRARAAHASALTRRGPRMSDFASGYNSPVAAVPANPHFGAAADSTLSGAKPFELEAELAALRRHLRQQIESRTALVTAHTAELAARDARQADLEQAIRLNEEELDEAEVAYDKLKSERDEARAIALKEQEKARENRKKLLEEQEANRLLKLVAKARAGEEETAMQSQIDRLRDELKCKEQEVERVRKRMEEEVKEAKRVVEEHKAAKLKAESEVDEVKQANQAMQVEMDQATQAKMALQAELDEALASVAEWKDKQLLSHKPAADEDDVDAEFQDLVRGNRAKDDLDQRLQQRELELDETQSQLASLRTELEQTRRELAQAAAAAEPQPELHRQLATLRDELAQSSEERQSLQIELAKLRAAATGREQEAHRVALLESDLAKANARICEMETEMAADKARAAEAVKKAASRPLPVPGSQGGGGGGGGSVPTSPVKALVGGSKLRPGATTPTSTVESGLNRAGSVKEYRRYPTRGETSSSACNPPSPSPASGSRSVILGHTSTFAGVRTAASSTALNASASTAHLAAAGRAEREEIERLNAVIHSQRAIMSDLEKSVASWKQRMKTQADLIHRLMLQTDATGASQSPPASDAETDDAFAAAASPRRKITFAAPDPPQSLPRTTHLSLSNNATSTTTPYYGAHTFNRPPPAGYSTTTTTTSTSSSPTKPFSTNYSANTWSHNSPHPLPLPDSVSPTKRKPRKTIEMDLKLLNSSPRVESGKSRFLFGSDASQDTPTKRRGTAASAYYI